MKSQRHLPLLLATVAMHANAHLPNVPGCENGKTTIEIAECRGKQFDAANSKLTAYLTAARNQAKKFDLDPSAIDAEQVAWEAYRTKHCGNVYELWRQGTIRYEMSAICMLEVTKTRTADVWRAYLTYADSTPPVLPDPSQ
jgi:uncharacterized protein YecT (DUF1311 family)